MIASPTSAYSDPWPITNSTFDPWQNAVCGTAYYQNGHYVDTIVVRPHPRNKDAEALAKFARYFEAIGRSRKMGRAPLPAPIVRTPALARRDPLLHHKLRCTTRRPRLSLLERVR